MLQVNVLVNLVKRIQKYSSTLTLVTIMKVYISRTAMILLKFSSYWKICYSCVVILFSTQCKSHNDDIFNNILHSAVAVKSFNI